MFYSGEISEAAFWKRSFVAREWSLSVWWGRLERVMQQICSGIEFVSGEERTQTSEKMHIFKLMVRQMCSKWLTLKFNLLSLVQKSMLNVKSCKLIAFIQSFPASQQPKLLYKGLSFTFSHTHSHTNRPLLSCKAQTLHRNKADFKHVLGLVPCWHWNNEPTESHGSGVSWSLGNRNYFR